MELQFTEEDILQAKEIYLYDERVLYIVDEKDNTYGFCKGSENWFLKENFWDYFDSQTMLAYFAMPTKEKAVQLYRSWKQ